MLILDQPPTPLATNTLLRGAGISSLPTAAAPFQQYDGLQQQSFSLLGGGGANARRRRIRPMSPQPLSFVPSTHQLYHDHIPYHNHLIATSPYSHVASTPTSSSVLRAASLPSVSASVAGAASTIWKLATTLRTMATTAAVTILPSMATTVSFLKLALVFIAGGLFFSSAVAFTTASLAIGQRNIKMFRQMAKIVWESVWLTFTMGLTATRETLLLGSATAGSGGSDSFLTTSNYNDYQHQQHYEKNGGLFSQRQPGQRPTSTLWSRYREAWNVLRCQLAETRRKAVEGVQALQREVKLCAAAVGAPGLIPLQYMLDRQLNFVLKDGIRGALEDAVQQVNMTNMELKLSHFNIGKEAPKLESARVYDLGDEAMAFDYDITWESELEATIQVQNPYLPSMTNVPVTLHDVYFRGPVRIVMAPLTNEFPGFGATLVSFPSMPEIGMEIRVAGGEVTKVVPMVRAEIMTAIERSISESMIWPKRVVVPSYPMDDPTTPILSETQLKELEVTDPLLEAEVAIGTRPVLRRKLNQMSDQLYCNSNGNSRGPSSCKNSEEEAEILKSIVDLPMPSFQHHKKDARATSKSKKKKKSNTRQQKQHQEQYHHLYTARSSSMSSSTATTTQNNNKKKAGEVVVLASTAKHHQVLWDQIQQAHQVVVDRSHADIAKTEQLLKQSGWWNDVKKIQVQAKDRLSKELQRISHPKQHH